VPTLLLATGCSLLNGSGGSDSSANPQNLEHPNIKVAYMALADCVPFELALKNGYFKQEGLNVTTSLVATGDETVTKLNAGSVDIGFSNWATIINAQATKTANLKIVADAVQGASHYFVVSTLPTSGISTPQQLVGKTVSTQTPNDVPSLGFRAVLQADGVDWSQIHVVSVPHPQTVQALATHKVDAAVQVEPFITQGERQLGAKPIIDLFGPDSPVANLSLAGYASTASFAQQNPKTVAAFARAMAKGAQDALNRQDVENILPTFTKIDKQTAKLIAFPTWPTSLDARRLQRVATLMASFGQLSNSFQVAPMIVPSPTS
jgi:NitT/TauT family transport system substrate-binding protein